jgi:hypothetical protein
MAPDQVTTIAVMDLSYNNGELQGRLKYYRELKNNKIHVIWDAQSHPKGYFSIRKGLVYYSVEKSKAKLESEGDRREDPVLLENSDYLWKESGYPPGSSLILMILILPKDYSLTVPDRKPIPVGAKEVDGRLAVYWIPIADSNTRTDVVWTLKKLKGSLVSEIQRINKSHAKVPESSSIKVPEEIPSWFPVAGVLFAAITSLFLMSLIVLSLFGREIPITSRFIVIAFLALSIGLSSTFLGGTAAAKGTISLPFFKEAPMSFAVTGGIAVFIIVLVLGYALYAR